jgi:hypothetical protein
VIRVVRLPVSKPEPVRVGARLEFVIESTSNPPSRRATKGTGSAPWLQDWSAHVRMCPVHAGDTIYVLSLAGQIPPESLLLASQGC